MSVSKWRHSKWELCRLLRRKGEILNQKKERNYQRKEYQKKVAEVKNQAKLHVKER